VFLDIACLESVEREIKMSKGTEVKEVPKESCETISQGESGDTGHDPGIFIAMKFEKLAVGHSTSKKVSSRDGNNTNAPVNSVSKDTKTIRKRKKKNILKRSKLGESLKLLERFNESDEDNLEIFGEKFSNSLNFSRLSINKDDMKRKEEPAEVFEGDQFTNLTVCGSKRKRSATPSFESDSLLGASCRQQVNQAAHLADDVTAEELAAYLEDTTFFPKRMSYMAEMMYT